MGRIDQEESHISLQDDEGTMWHHHTACHCIASIFARIFGGVRNYHTIYGISSMKFMACFSIVTM